MVDVIEILKNLISIQSFSDEEKEITDHVGRLLSAHGINTWKRYGNTIVWQSDIREDRKTVAFAGHVDTVGFDEENWERTHPLKPVQEGNLLYGRGACDMKSGIAVLLKLLIEQNYGEKYNIVFIFYDREEQGMPNGITDLLEIGVLPTLDFVIIPEPTELKVNYGVFGSIDATIHAYGKAAHTSRAETGDNAIYTLCKAIAVVRKIPLLTVDGKEEKLSVNMIKGGTDNNIVPHKASATIDFRYNPYLSFQEVKTRLNTIKDDGYEVKIDYIANGVVHNPSDPFIERLNALGEGSYIDIYWSDIAQFAQAGIIAVNFGPGSIEQAHKADEYVDVRHLRKVEEIFTKFLTGE